MSSFLPPTSYNFSLQAEAYEGTGQSSTPITYNRDPTPLDLSGPTAGFKIGQLWWSRATNQYFSLQSIVAGVATWTPLASAGAGVLTIQGLAPVLNNFNFSNLGGLSIMAVPGTVSVGANVDGVVTQIVANQITVQKSSAAPAPNALLNGVSHFDSAQFTVDPNGFVQLTGGGIAIEDIQVDAVTAPGVNPVTPNGGGTLTITGVQVAAGTVATAIRSNTIALNTVRMEVQRSSAQGVSTLAANGVSHFNSAQFTVDANGFVSAIASGTSSWLDSAGGPLVNHTGYFATAAAAYTLPAGVANGDMVEIVDFVGGGVVLTAQGGDLIRIGNSDSSVNGTATSAILGDALRLVFRAVGQVWVECPGSQGIWILA